MLRTLMNKVDSRQEQIGNISRQEEILKKKKRNDRDKKYCNIKIVLDGLIIDGLIIDGHG